MTWAMEIESPVSANRMFHAGVLDWHYLGPKIAPEVLESGTDEGHTRQLNFTSVMPFSHVKERMDFVDNENFECETTITEGGLLGTKLESVTVNYKINDTIDGDGCTIKVITTSKPLPGIELDVDEVEVIDKAKEAMVKHFKIVEDFLVANPDKYDVPPPQSNKLIPVSGDDGDVVLPDTEGGESHPRQFYGRQSNGMVIGNAIQSGNGGYFGGVQANGMVIGNAVQSGGGFYGGGGGGYINPGFNPGWGSAWGRGGF